MTGSNEHCGTCGWPTTQPLTTISRHHTSEGLVTYTRCACGTVRMWLSPTTFTTPHQAGHP
ncbi:hypothetical protein [Nocardia sp.]|uniref:hypothetical protein n=1 Tax=Nocardia sp. TaxID=1821 RepID=UPI00261FB98F|nr:hypothetical protein [Nocardia sp.]